MKSTFNFWIYSDVFYQHIEIHCNMRKKKILDSNFMIIPFVNTLYPSIVQIKLYQSLEFWSYYTKKIKKKSFKPMIFHLFFFNLIKYKLIPKISRKVKKGIKQYQKYSISLEVFLEEEFFLRKIRLLKMLEKKKNFYKIGKRIFFLFFFSNFFEKKKKETDQREIGAFKKIFFLKFFT
ncbi:hypothetical protein CMESO_361 (nucleomorph) [Chroomonas mesostigmatica CCMP1168]|uniref:Uncharacterized protein n=1 Tax=Chroomonas mesostigmatica CCMP1168 TaxID=1195612 RepID=J7G8C1_9CRYP|nr:hypothetical protein CMESO_361 [Chroomonas mesostigmatica CCMP1168]